MRQVQHEVSAKGYRSAYPLGQATSHIWMNASQDLTKVSGEPESSSNRPSDER